MDDLVSTLIDANTTFGENADGLFQEHTQVLTDDFMESLKSERYAKAALRAGEHDRVASIPTFVVELWLRQGVPFYQMSAKQIVAKLRADDLDAFITTPKAQ